MDEARKAQDIEIRWVTSKDARVLDCVADGVFDEPVDDARLATYLTEPGHIMFVAIAGGQVVGQCAAVIHRHPDKVTELYVDEVGVAPGFTRRGIARRLLDQMLAFGKAAGCQEAWVGTEPDNQPVRGLYESRGATAEPFVMYVYKL
jgi:ribosomal protein S18 acetylase RimI-like enzyme